MLRAACRTAHTLLRSTSSIAQMRPPWQSSENPFIVVKYLSTLITELYTTSYMCSAGTCSPVIGEVSEAENQLNHFLQSIAEYQQLYIIMQRTSPSAKGDPNDISCCFVEEVDWRCPWQDLPDMAIHFAGFERMVIAGLTSFTFYIPGRMLRQLGLSQGQNRAGTEDFCIPNFSAQTLHEYRSLDSP
ncbi:hypothetical protein RHMOL_Rhmol11G0021100 [Rhododendron molle]|uniref:Uncharacterized protein n=1 Tax=Rhododendron molle TaxID=49168 RepID=A0ACC0LMZ9_RHOML|nr:hypothetical protein RHMOL_Rhmol11G0021100 [Rhododendron molle]